MIHVDSYTVTINSEYKWRFAMWTWLNEIKNKWARVQQEWYVCCSPALLRVLFVIQCNERSLGSVTRIQTHANKFHKLSSIARLDLYFSLQTNNYLLYHKIKFDFCYDCVTWWICRSRVFFFVHFTYMHFDVVLFTCVTIFFFRHTNVSYGSSRGTYTTWSNSDSVAVRNCK